MPKQFYTDAHAAMRDGNHFAPCGVSFRHGSGWALYDLKEGPGPHETPEILCYKSGRLPLALSDEGAQIIAALVCRAG
jgi:hypothetical protein